MRQTIVEVVRSQVRPGQIACPVCGVEHVGRLFKAPKVAVWPAVGSAGGPAQAALTRHKAAQKAERDFLEDSYDDHGLVFCDYRGLPLEIVLMILGHSSPEVTRRVYRHLMRKATIAP